MATPITKWIKNKLCVTNDAVESCFLELVIVYLESMYGMGHSCLAVQKGGIFFYFCNPFSGLPVMSICLNAYSIITLFSFFWKPLSGVVLRVGRYIILNYIFTVLITFVCRKMPC